LQRDASERDAEPWIALGRRVHVLGNPGQQVEDRLCDGESPETGNVVNGFEVMHRPFSE
jgi:hypothetical protein